MKKLRMFTIIIWLLVFASFAALLILRTGKNENTGADDEIVLIETDTSMIREVYVRNGTEYAYSLTTEDGEKWMLNTDQDDAAEAKSGSVSDMISVLSRITASRAIENVRNLSDYGLSEDDPYFSIRVVLNDGSGYEIKTGDYSPAASMYYARIEGRDPVFLVTTLLKATFDVDTEMLKEE